MKNQLKIILPIIIVSVISVRANAQRIISNSTPTLQPSVYLRNDPGTTNQSGQQYGYIFSNMPNGIMFQSNTTGIDTNNATGHMVINNAGNIGIGTPSPSAKLDLKLNTDTDFLRIIRNSSLGRSQLVLADENASQIWRFGITGSGSNNFSFYDGTQNTLLLEQNGDVLLNPAGNVGIGTTSPDELLHIEGSSGSTIRIADTAINTYLELSSGNSGSSRAHINTGTGGSSIDFKTAGVDRMSLTTTGLGIGTTSPLAKLHIKQSDAKGLRFERSGHDSYEIRLAGSKGLWFLNATDGSYDMAFDGNGNVSIGTTTPATGFKLSVAGKIISEEVMVKLQSTGWPDYVFSKNYQLKSLAETESYIKKEGHLPNIPSAQDVAENGIELGEMNAKLLEKIEELTLHLINQQKEIEALKIEVKNIKK